MIKRKIILARIKRIEDLPSSVGKALKTMNDPDVDMGQLTSVLERDPAITANILRLANSAYFGATHKIASLRDAVVRLGSKQLFQLMLTVAVAPRMSPAVSGYDMPACALLEQSLAVAVASELSAATLDIQAPPHTFTAGLLANIGKIVLGQFLEVSGQEIVSLAEEREIPFDQAEREILGIDHLEVGAELLRNWSIPEEIVQVVRYRLQPDLLPSRNLALDLVHVGDAITRMTGIGQGFDGMHYPISGQVIERLGMNSRHVEQIMSLLVDRVEELQRLLPKCEGDI
ncbi:MAG: HDOD domain-containing protein [Deltaproteobacteria bacterium]|nr:HDOD domain-containing protein [Deltaproteobacteria bacterium]